MTAGTATRPVDSRAERFISNVTAVSPVVMKLGQGGSSTLTINELEETVGTDPELSLRILSLANSAFYSQLHEVTELRIALIVLGAETVHSLAASLLAGTLLDNADADAAEIWRHCQAVGAAAELVAEVHRRVDPRRAYVAGLLHDLGLLAVLRAEPDAYRRALSAGDAQYSGIPHAELGAEVAGLMGLSPTLAAAIRHHDDAEYAVREANPLEASIYVAEHLADVCGYPLGTDNAVDPEVFGAVVATLGLVESDIETLKNCLPDRVQKLADVMRASSGERR